MDTIHLVVDLMKRVDELERICRNQENLIQYLMDEEYKRKNLEEEEN